MAAAEVSRDQVLPHDAVFASMCIKHRDSSLGGPVQHPSHPHPHPGLADTDGESPSIPMGCYGWSTGQGGVSKDAAKWAKHRDDRELAPRCVLLSR